jgi:peptide/nickel transport system substrate-binding protein
MLAERVKAGELPPVEERLPVEPVVVQPVEEVGRYGGTIRVGYVTPMRWHTSSFSDWGTILQTDTDYQTIVPNLARNYDMAADGRSLTLQLREGARWSDGEPFTADDILFWYEDVLLNDDITPAKPKSWQAGGELMKLVRVSDYEIRLEFAAPNPTIIYRLAQSSGGQESFFLPKHYMEQFHPRYVEKAELEKRAKAAGFDFWYQYFQAKADSDGTTSAIEVDVPVMRAMKLVSKDINVAMFERNPFYWKVDTAGNQLPYIDKAIVTRYENMEIWNMKAMTGELDIAHRNTALANLPMYQSNVEDGGYRLLMWRNMWGAIVNLKPNLNHKDPVMREILQDVRFRRALSMAIDRDEINNVVCMGLGEPRQSSMPPTSAYFEPEFATAYAQFDPDRSNALLDEMGLRWDSRRQWRLRPDGKPLTIVLEYFPGESGPQKTSTCELVAEHWREIGVNLVLKEVLLKTLLQREQSLDLDMTLWHMGGLSDALYITRPRDFAPHTASWQFWGIDWARWYESDGKEGTEPPPIIKRTLELYELMNETIDEEQQIAYGKELGSILAENLWNFGTVGMIPKPVLVKDYLRNVPEEAMWDWAYMYLDVVHPEQFFIAR